MKVAGTVHRDGDRLVLRTEQVVGNSFFMTLGNIHLDPRCGLVFLDWETGRSLQLSGTGRINWDPGQVDRFPGARRVVEFTVDHVVDIEAASPLRWRLEAYSRLNPPAPAGAFPGEPHPAGASGPTSR
ncbi:pyridoxamine 5'-phosphate oxidase family protein [Plantactinospora sp. B5E13]|uniref:pyridoxamine 5'-phosphate oxidase family protein n=1 Tax=Plantactinospora sp. B5E13 TaxID=3153758 RepID=UPI00325CC4E0